LLNLCRGEASVFEQYGFDLTWPVSDSEATIPVIAIHNSFQTMMENARTGEFLCLAQMHPSIRKKHEKKLHAMATDLKLDDHMEYEGLTPRQIADKAVNMGVRRSMNSFLGK